MFKNKKLHIIQMLTLPVTYMYDILTIFMSLVFFFTYQIFCNSIFVTNCCIQYIILDNMIHYKNVLICVFILFNRKGT